MSGHCPDRAKNHTVVERETQIQQQMAQGRIEQAQGQNQLQTIVEPDLRQLLGPVGV
jgi:hypothetical protein